MSELANPDDEAAAAAGQPARGINPAVSDLLEAANIPDQDSFNASYALKTLKYLRRPKKSESLDLDDFQTFLSRVISFAPLSKAQLFQDLWAWWESGFSKDAFFVEFGAGNGVRLSNTYFLEKTCGWHGIVAEPHPDFMASIKANRECYVSNKCVYSRSGETVKFLVVSNGELSRIASVNPQDAHELAGLRKNAREVEVQTISLNDLLDEAGAPDVIDYMSIDTEGSEYEILKSYDFSRRKIRTISVEHNRTPMRAALFELLSANGYRRKWEPFSRFDDWYVLTQ